MQQGRVTLTTGQLPAGFSVLVRQVEAPAVSRGGGVLRQSTATLMRELCGPGTADAPGSPLKQHFTRAGFNTTLKAVCPVPYSPIIKCALYGKMNQHRSYSLAVDLLKCYFKNLLPLI